ncbi:MAG: RNA polymerase sigma factor [Nocardiaceae bacterium]|nr:RNA polymerase sigma factor [Nocardiaceae bacterium]
MGEAKNIADLHGDLAALRAGDEGAYRELIATHHGLLRQMASWYVPVDDIDEVLQETWTAVFRGIDRFEGRSSLRTWICQILLNQARRRHGHSLKSIPYSAVAPATADPELADAGLLHDTLGPGYWRSVPPVWWADPEGRLLGSEITRVASDALDQLTGAQREVVVLRDVEGWSSEETCEALGISSANQRVLLHRGRAVVRQALQEYFDGE